MDRDESQLETELATRVLILAPTRRDAEVTYKLLTNIGITCFICLDPRSLAHEIVRGAGAVLTTEHLAGAHGVQTVTETLAKQETWSDLPVVMLIPGDVLSAHVRGFISSLRNVTLIDRPAPTSTVTGAVLAALRARRRQYEIRHLIEREQAARQEGERANRIKDEFLATLSHELRTPLNAIFGWAQILKMDPSNLATVTEAAKVIDRNIRMQTQLIEDLLDMSRIISGKIRLDVQRIELPDVIQAAIDAVIPAIQAKEIHLQRVVDPLVGAVNGDFSRLQQVFWNLINNAVKFTPKGGRIDVLCQSINSHVEVSIADTGEGIDPEFLPHLFERFTQADGSTKRRHGGLGLGLSIVKNLVELHGGTIQAHSLGEGMGAQFVIRLPLRTVEVSDDSDSQAGAATSPQTFISDLSQLRGMKVLIIDDEQDARELVRRFLAEHLAVPVVAGSAVEAESLLVTFTPDIIVSDIGMPGEDGYDFIRRIRTRGMKTPAIALTAFARAEDRTRALDAGFQSHLSKPVDPAKLLAVMIKLHGPKVTSGDFSAAALAPSSRR